MKTTTRPRDAIRGSKASDTAGVAARPRNELPETLVDVDLDEELDDQQLRDRLVRERGRVRELGERGREPRARSLRRELVDAPPQDALVVNGPASVVGGVGLSAAVQAAVFAPQVVADVGDGAPPPMAGPVEAVQRAADPAAELVDEPAAETEGWDEPIQAKREAGTPADDPEKEPEDEELDPPKVVGARDKVEPGEVDRASTETSRSLVYKYESNLPLQKKGGHAVRPPLLPSLRSGGRALPDVVRRKMEEAFGVDFSTVRVLEGPEATAIGALAFARGEQIFFAPGKYDPLSPRGQELLGHELAHVVQQRVGRVRAEGGDAVNADPSLEREADSAGAAAARGQSARVSGASAAAQPKLAPSAVQLNSDKTKKLEKWLAQDQVKKVVGDVEAPEASTDSGVKFEKSGVSKQEERGTIKKDVITLKSGIVLKDVSGTAVFRNDELVEFEGAATAIIPLAKQETFSFQSADLKVDAQKGVVLTGTGEVELLRALQVGQAGDYRIQVEKGAKGSATITENSLSEIHGKLALTLHDGQGELVRLELDGSVDPPGDAFTGTATATLVRKLLIREGLGPAKNWSLWLNEGQTVTATLDKNRLIQLDGKLILGVEDEAGAFAELELVGKMLIGQKDQPNKLTAESGTARLLREHQLFEVPELGWTVHQLAGMEVTVRFEEGQPAGFEGTLPFMVRDAKGDVLKATVTGSLDLKGKLTGEASIELMRPAPIKLGADGADLLTVQDGASLKLSFVDSELTAAKGAAKALWDTTFQEQPAQWELEAEVDIDLKARTVKSAAGSATLKTPLKLDEVTRLDALKGAVTVENGNITKVEGELTSTLFDEQGDLVKAEVKGTWERGEEGPKVSGTGKATLLRNLDWTISESTQTVGRVLAGTSATATYAEGKLTTIEGLLKGQILIAGEAWVGAELSGKLDVQKKQITEGKGKATLLKAIDLLDGKVQVTGASLEAELKDGQIVQVGGTVKVSAPALKVDQAEVGFGWRTANGENLYKFWGVIDWTFFDEGDRKLTGQLDVRYNEDKTFKATAGVKYQLNKFISGGGKLDVDEKLEPQVLEAWLKYEQTLVEARDLFRIKIPIVDMTIPVGLPGVNLEFGISVGTGLAMEALKASSEIKLTEPWKLKADDAASRVPAFETTFTPTWGATFDANVAAWLGLALGAAIAKVALGAKGKVVAKVRLSTDPSVTIGGGGDQGFYGKMRVGAKVTPTLELQIIPYARAVIPGIYEAEKEFDGYTKPIGELAGLDWGYEYAWGDKGSSATQHDQKVETSAGGKAEDTVQETKVEFPESVPSAQGGQDAPKVDGAAVASASKEKGNAAKGTSEGEGKSKLDHIIAIAKGFSALVDLAELVGGAIKSLLVGGPIGFAIWAAWNAFKGRLNWDDLKAKVAAVQEALKSVKELLGDKLNPTVLAIINVLTGEVSIKDALFGNKPKMRDEIAKGAHLKAEPEVRSEMVNVLMRGICGDDDEAAILTVLRASATKGDLAAVMLTVNGGPDEVVWKLDGRNEDAVKALFKANGVPMKDGWFGESGSAQLAQQQAEDPNSYQGTPAKRRAGMIDKLLDSGDAGKKQLAITVIEYSATQGDLGVVASLVGGGAGELRSKLSASNQRASLEKALARAQVHDFSGADPVQVVSCGAGRLLNDTGKGKLLKSFMDQWYINEDEENAMFRLMRDASSVSAVVAAAGGGAAVKDRITGASSTRVEQLFRQSGIQFAGGKGQFVAQAASAGISGSAGSLPHADAIQASFGRHDISGIQAHTDGAAAQANAAMGSKAFATGDHVAFQASPDLHTAAHEAAHTVQQKAGVQLKDGVGQAGDAHERHADAVADAVVQGKSAEGLLDQYAGGGASAGVQHMLVQYVGQKPNAQSKGGELRAFAVGLKAVRSMREFALQLGGAIDKLLPKGEAINLKTELDLNAGALVLKLANELEVERTSAGKVKTKGQMAGVFGAGKEFDLYFVEGKAYLGARFAAQLEAQGDSGYEALDLSSFYLQQKIAGWGRLGTKVATALWGESPEDATKRVLKGMASESSGENRMDYVEGTMEGGIETGASVSDGDEDLAGVKGGAGYRTKTKLSKGGNGKLKSEDDSGAYLEFEVDVGGNKGAYKYFSGGGGEHEFVAEWKVPKKYGTLVTAVVPMTNFLIDIVKVGQTKNPRASEPLIALGRLMKRKLTGNWAALANYGANSVEFKATAKGTPARWGASVSALDTFKFKKELDVKAGKGEASVALAAKSEIVQFAGGKGQLVGQAAAAGISGSAGSLPYAETIQASFGRHDISGIQAHTDGAAAQANAAMGSKAFATGDHVAFQASPDLHTAAHEAAHTVQQKAGVQLKDGVGQPGDAHERHADAVADAVVQGKSAEGLLDQYAGPAQAAGAGDALPGDEGDAGAVQAQADDALGDALAEGGAQAQAKVAQRKAAPAAQRKAAPAARTDAVQHLAEHFDDVMSDDEA